MAIIKVLNYPDPRLKRKAVPVEVFDEKLKQVVDDMFETHYSLDNCAALAATQLDLDPPWRITVIDFTREKNKPLVLINPQIIEREGEHMEAEGCMSVYPRQIQSIVKRAEKIKVRAQDIDGKVFEMDADGFMAKCIQHELDHLDGVVFLDKISKIKRNQLEIKIRKIRKKLAQSKG